MGGFNFTAIGSVVSEFCAENHFESKEKLRSKIIVKEEYLDALYNIEINKYLDVVFCFHLNDSFHLKGKTKSGGVRGVFASRSPRRPNPIGVTRVKLISRQGNVLVVEGLDAYHHSPVLDIKSADTSLEAFHGVQDPVHQSILKSDPRIDIRNYISQEANDLLLLKAGELHGHFCPGLAMGVMAAVHAVNKLGTDSDGMEDVLAIVETNNCFADGVQYVTACSLGNNSLIYKDLGKTAFTLSKRDGKGIRICARHDAPAVVQNAFPEFQAYYQKVVTGQNHDPELVGTFKKLSSDRAFGTLGLSFEKLFKVEEVQVEIPQYASIHDSAVCSKCNESVMENKTRPSDQGRICKSCSGQGIETLDGDGLHCDRGASYLPA